MLLPDDVRHRATVSVLTKHACVQTIFYCCVQDLLPDKSKLTVGIHGCVCSLLETLIGSHRCLVCVSMLPHRVVFFFLHHVCRCTSPMWSARRSSRTAVHKSR